MKVQPKLSGFQQNKIKRVYKTLFLCYNISMKKKMTIKIKPEDLNLRNELHFEVQRRTRAHIYRNKKGKGSFKREKKVDFDV